MGTSRRPFSPPFSALTDIELFAVDERSTQLIVRSNSTEVLTTIDDQVVTTPVAQGVAVIDIIGLAPDTEYRATFATTAGASLGAIELRTRPTIGAVRSRFATISDVHLGTDSFGGGRSITDEHPVPYPLRCGRSAIAEATAWGAEVLMVKGDLTDTGGTSEWELARQLFANVSIPFMFTPGNHDVWKSRDLDPIEGAGILGVTSQPLHHHDLDGIRLVMADTAKPDRGGGDLARSIDALEAVTNTDRPVFLGIHHNIQRAPVTWFWPPGISSTNAMPVVETLAKRNPNLFISSGHTHRNRVHWLGPEQRVAFTEVSATSDYPGVWAAYEVGEHTIRQTVRRIANPEATRWTEKTRSALFGVWPRWSQGRLADRCVDLPIT